MSGTLDFSLFRKDLVTCAFEIFAIYLFFEIELKLFMKGEKIFKLRVMLYTSGKIFKLRVLLYTSD